VLRRTPRSSGLVVLAALAGCGGGDELTTADLPLADGLSITAPASSCGPGNRDCPVKAFVAGAPGATAGELIVRQQHSLRQNGWRTGTEEGGRLSATKGELVFHAVPARGGLLVTLGHGARQ
jgi:hypothetical protein